MAVLWFPYPKPTGLSSICIAYHSPRAQLKVKKDKIFLQIYPPQRKSFHRCDSPWQSTCSSYWISTSCPKFLGHEIVIKLGFFPQRPQVKGSLSTAHGKRFQIWWVNFKACSGNLQSDLGVGRGLGFLAGGEVQNKETQLASRIKGVLQPAQ